MVLCWAAALLCYYRWFLSFIIAGCYFAPDVFHSSEDKTL